VPPRGRPFRWESASFVCSEGGDGLIEFFRKPWWVGPLVASVSFSHYQTANRTAALAAVSGYEVVNNRGILPRNGRVVVAATCPAGKRAIGGGYAAPSAADTADSSSTEGNNAWRVSFKSNGGSGAASVYAICVTADQPTH
jgi:hypothetical protein